MTPRRRALRTCAGSAALLIACAPAPPVSVLPSPAAPPAQAPNPAGSVEDLVREGELRRALRVARDAAEDWPGDRRLACLSVEIATLLGDFRRAEEALAVLQGVKAPIVECDVAFARAALDRRRTAARDSTRSRELLAQARAALARGDSDAAQAQVLEAWAADPPNGLLLIEAGSIAAKRGKPAEARALYDRGLSELELASGATVVAAPPRALGQVSAVERSPAGALLAVADGHALSVFDASSEEIRRFPVICTSLAWTAPKALFCAAADGRVLCVDAEAGSAREVFRVPAGWPSVASSGNAWLATGGGRAFHSNGGGPVELPVRGVRRGALSPDGELIALGLDNGDVAFVSPRTRRVRLTVRRPGSEPAGAIRVLRFSDDGSSLGATADEGRARVLRVADGRLRALLPFTGDFRFAPGGEVLVTTAGAYAIHARHPAGPPPLHGPLALAGPAGDTVSVTFEGALVSQPLDAGPARVLRPAPAALERAFDLTLAELATAAKNQGRYPWPSERGQAPVPQECGAAPGTRSRDGRYSACGGANFTLWDARAGKLRWSVPAPLAPVGALELSPEQHLVLAAGARGQAVVLALDDGRTLAHVTLTGVDTRRGTALARGSVSDPAGNLGFIGPEPADPGRCWVGVFGVPLEVCRNERVRPHLLSELFTRQK